MNAIFGINTDFMSPLQGLKYRLNPYRHRDYHPVLRYTALSGLQNIKAWINNVEFDKAMVKRNSNVMADSEVISSRIEWLRYISIIQALKGQHLSGMGAAHLK